MIPTQSPSVMPTQSPSSSNRPSVSSIPSLAPSLVPTKGPSSNSITDDFTTWQFIGQIWWVLLILILAVIFYVGISEYYKKIERADPNSNYSRRQQNRRRVEARREYNRRILANAERRRRDWDYLWDEEGGMMRRELKREYILSNLCTKIYGDKKSSNKKSNEKHKEEPTQHSYDEEDYERKLNQDDEDEDIKDQIMTDELQVVEEEEKQSEGSNQESQLRQQKYDDDHQQQQQQQQQQPQKPNSPKGILKGMVSNVLSLTSSSRRSRGKQVEDYDFESTTCGICLEDFRKGDEICISTDSKHNASTPSATTTTTNPTTAIDHCDHVFHVDCMLKWLIKNRAAGRCPLCRKTFLSMDEYDNFYQFQQRGASNSTPNEQVEQDEMNENRNGESGDDVEENRDNDQAQEDSTS